MDEPEVLWGFLVGPALAFLTGFIMRPRHVWVAPMIVAVLVFIAICVATVLDVVQPMVALPVVFVYTALSVALPQTILAWLGKQLRLEHWHHQGTGGAAA